MRACAAIVALSGCLSDKEPPDCKQPPVLLEELNTNRSEQGPWLSPDRLEIFFSSDRSGTSRLYHGVRSSQDERFNEVTEIPNLPASPLHTPFVESDGLTMWFAAQDAPVSTTLYRAKRTVLQSIEFFDVAPAQVTADGLGGHPSLTSDGLTLYFDARNASLQGRIYRATRTSRGSNTWTVAEDDHMRGMLAHVFAPSIKADGQRLLFSGTPDLSATTPFRIYESDLLDGHFEPGVLEEDVGGLDQFRDEDPMLHAGGETIVFASNRSGDLDLYMACP